VRRLLRDAAVGHIFGCCYAQEDGAGVGYAGGEEGGVGFLAFVDCGVWVRGEGRAHGEEFLFGADESADGDWVFRFGRLGGGLEQAVENRAADLACSSEDGVGGHFGDGLLRMCWVSGVLFLCVLGSRYSGMVVVEMYQVLKVRCALGVLEMEQHQG
jgi:hypothetical protein